MKIYFIKCPKCNSQDWKKSENSKEYYVNTCKKCGYKNYEFQDRLSFIKAWNKYKTN